MVPQVLAILADGDLDDEIADIVAPLRELYDNVEVQLPFNVRYAEIILIRETSKIKAALTHAQTYN